MLKFGCFRPSFDLSSVSAATEGFSGADLQAAVYSARLAALKRKIAANAAATDNADEKEEEEEDGGGKPIRSHTVGRRSLRDRQKWIHWVPKNMLTQLLNWFHYVGSFYNDAGKVFNSLGAQCNSAKRDGSHLFRPTRSIQLTLQVGRTASEAGY